MRHGAKETLLLIALGIGWGLTQPLGKIAASTGRPAMGLIFWQLVTCVLVLGALTLMRGRGTGWRWRHASFFVTVALLGTVIPNYAFYTSIAVLPSGVMSILISTIPLITLPINLALGSERLDMRRLLGLALGLGAVTMIVLPDSALPDRAMLAFVPFALIGPLCYALENTYVARMGLGGMDAIAAMFGASLVAAVIVGFAILVTGQFYWPDGSVQDAALFSGSALHALLYATYIWLAARTGAVFASQSSYVITVSGVIFAMILLSETPSPWIWAAMVVLLAGMSLVKPKQMEHITA